ncbi:MAG: dienelactone hydrolase family protein [Thermomicrobiaceae bacterium]|nr:dienelactone hydrolase family protein [Thermomicrobiaceae bacterium]
MRIESVTTGGLRFGYQPVTVTTDRGEIAMRFYGVPDARVAALWVGGVGGDFDSPARDLYPDLCERLKQDQVASLRVQFRHPTELEEAVLDVLAGVTYLEEAGIERIGLVGHSFGGAVVIQAAAAAESVATVVTLATQSYGASVVDRLGPRCSILLIHGADDQVLPPSCSTYVHRLAREPKRLIVYDGADHGLDQVADELRRVVRAWLLDQLQPGTE